MKNKEFNPFLRGIIIVAVLIALLVGAYYAVGGISYLKHKNDVAITDSELKALFAELVPRAEKVNEIVFGTGLEISPDAEKALVTEDESSAQYRPVADTAEYKSVDEIRKAAAEVYSEAYLKSVVNVVAFDGYTDEEKPEVASSTINPRYKDIKNTDGEVKLNADITYKPYKLTAVYNADSVKVSENELEKNGMFWRVSKVKVDIEYTMDGKTANRTVTIVKESDGWKLDEPLY